MAFNPFQQQTTTIPWVQGEVAAKSYLVAPGSSVILMDSEQPLFYIKSVDQSGMPSLRKFKYEEISVTGDNKNFVTHEELEKRLSKLMNSNKKKGASE